MSARLKAITSRLTKTCAPRLPREPFRARLPTSRAISITLPEVTDARDIAAVDPIQAVPLLPSMLGQHSVIQSWGKCISADKDGSRPDARAELPLPPGPARHSTDGRALKFDLVINLNP